MSQNSTDQTPPEQEMLQRLVHNNSGLEHLERLLGEFNIFEAIGMVSQEIRHSAFLAFLLTPGQSHGLGDRFLKAVLRLSGEDLGDLLDADLMATRVEREWQNIDVLAVNGRHRLALLIENKVYSGEHSDQLATYYSKVQHHYSGYRIVCLYLTLTGQAPTHPAYRAVSYPAITTATEALQGVGRGVPNPEVATALTHYVKMLRRHMLGDKELERACLQIYHQHKRAIDAIIRYMPKAQEQMRDFLVALVERTDGLILSSVYKDQYVAFCPVSWDLLIPKIQPDPWSPSGRNFQFWFAIQPDSLGLALQIRQGPLEERQRLFDIAMAHRPLFSPQVKAVKEKYTDVYWRTIIDASRYASAPLDEIMAEVSDWWDDFCATDLPQIEAIYAAELKPSSASLPLSKG